MKLNAGIVLTVWVIAPVLADRPPASAPAAEPVAAAWDVLDRSLADTNENRRRQAVLAIGTIGDPHALKSIEAALQDKSSIVRQTAAAVLGEMKATESIPYLKQALGDNAEVSFTAAKSLVEMDDESGREILQQVLTGERKDKPGFIENNLKHAKKKLTPAEMTMMGVREASGVLLGPAGIGIVVAEEAIKGGKPDKDAVSGRAIAIATLADHPNEYARMLLEWALTDNDQNVRALAAKGLGKCGNEQSIPKLQTALADQHTAVRDMAAASIIRLSPK